MGTKRKRGGWTAKRLLYLDRVQAVISTLESYWPLTLRQIYYQLVAAGVIDNRVAAYQKLSEVLTKARLDGLVPWETMEDRGRSTLQSGGWRDEGHFILTQTNRYLTGYRRDLLQSQPVALELWIEKDALSRICHTIALPYCVPVIVARGFTSVSYVNECRKRVNAALARGKHEVRILYFGDFDPSGYEMLPAMLETLQEEMHLGSAVSGRHYALTPQQARTYDLPHNPDALKETDSRAEKFVAQYGTVAYELDALPPATLGTLVETAILENLDKSLFESERECEIEDVEHLEELHDDVHAFIRDRLANDTQREGR